MYIYIYILPLKLTTNTVFLVQNNIQKLHSKSNESLCRTLEQGYTGQALE